ncbi:MAG: hypothetical protein R6U44_06795 [Archaeoglobaceae archaeon]
MKKKVTILAILAMAFALVMAGSAIGKPGNGNGNAGPAEKATGNVTLYEPWDGGYRVVDFNAHEEKGVRDAKGMMVDNVYGPDGDMRRLFEYDVEYVNVEGDYAYFGAKCTYDSGGDSGGDKTGDWLYVVVEDGGTPGMNGDAMGWSWGSEDQVASWVENDGSTGWWRTPIAGNLVVHTYN